MASQSKLTASEVARRGEQIYEEQLRERVEPGNFGKLLAIDIHTGQYEIGNDHLEVVDRVRARLPEAEIYTLKIGYPATAVIGGRLLPNRPPRQ